MTFINGKLVIGSGSGYTDICFIKERMSKIHPAAEYTGDYIWNELLYNPPVVVERPGLGIVHNAINDVAMTILPNAPIDDDTGLPVPTIAVATDGGVSVIRDDGTVVDITCGQISFIYSYYVIFDQLNRLFFSLDGQGNSRRMWGLNDIPATDLVVTTDINEKQNADIFIADDNGYGTATKDMFLFNQSNPQTTGFTPDSSIGTNKGLFKAFINREDSSKSLHNYTTSKYNTGWMPGDIKLATLSDTTVENIGVNSDELVVDGDGNWVGDFNAASDLDDWTKTGDVAGITITEGKLRIERTNTLTHATYVMSVVKGVMYQVSADIQAVSGGGGPGLRLSKAEMVAGSSLVAVGLSQNDNTRKFRADYTGLLYISAYHGTAAGVSNFDNISVRTTTELITNGDFSIDAAAENFATAYPDWTANNAVLSVAGGKLRVDDTADAGTWSSAVQQIDLVPGKQYTLSMNTTIVDLGSSYHVGIHSSSSFSGTDIDDRVAAGITEYGAYNITFTASTANYLFVGVGGTGVVDFDDISVRPAEEDRSVNNNGLQIVGEINKAPVAPGADLVAYSGFSVNNYLVQPYNADLDFGTGDFCVMGWVKTTSSANQKIFTRDLNLANRFQVYINNGGVSVFTEEDDQSSYLEGSTDVNSGSWFNFYCIRKSGVLEVYVNAKKENTQASLNHETARNLNFGEIPSYVGKHIHNTSNSFEGSIALFRVSKTAPTAAQIAKIYRDEKALFQDGAQSTLYGTSDSVTALAYDDSEQLLHVGTASGRSDFRGLARVNNTTTAISNSISAAEGTIIQN